MEEPAEVVGFGQFADERSSWLTRSPHARRIRNARGSGPVRAHPAHLNAPGFAFGEPFSCLEQDGALLTWSVWPELEAKKVDEVSDAATMVKQVG